MQRKSAAMVFAVLATLVYLGLAIWGRGGFAAFFSHPARFGGCFCQTSQHDSSSRLQLRAYLFYGIVARKRRR